LIQGGYDMKNEIKKSKKPVIFRILILLLAALMVVGAVVMPFLM
jgi:hypothetical protein